MNHRDTIFLEEAPVLDHRAWPGDQFVLRLEAPKCARAARPGQFVHLTVDPLLPLRRPISIQRVSPQEGWVELLYKVVGKGTALLAEKQPGDRVSLLGPVGRPFEVNHRRPLLIGGGVGMPPMVFLAEQLSAQGRADDLEPLVILGSEVPFPFEPQDSLLPVAGVPRDLVATHPLLESWGVPCRLASTRPMPGVFRGYVTDLARAWLEALEPEERKEVALFACGPHPMLEAVVALAREYDLPVQVSLEEFMACGVGGCAGCVVEVQTETGPAMQRVCVDGPVFDGYRVFA